MRALGEPEDGRAFVKAELVRAIVIINRHTLRNSPFTQAIRQYD